MRTLDRLIDQLEQLHNARQVRDYSRHSWHDGDYRYRAMNKRGKQVHEAVALVDEHEDAIKALLVIDETYHEERAYYQERRLRYSRSIAFALSELWALDRQLTKPWYDYALSGNYYTPEHARHIVNLKARRADDISKQIDRDRESLDMVKEGLRAILDRRYMKDSLIAQHEKALESARANLRSIERLQDADVAKIEEKAVATLLRTPRKDLPEVVSMCIDCCRDVRPLLFSTIYPYLVHCRDRMKEREAEDSGHVVRYEEQSDGLYRLNQDDLSLIAHNSVNGLSIIFKGAAESDSGDDVFIDIDKARLREILGLFKGETPLITASPIEGLEFRTSTGFINFLPNGGRGGYPHYYQAKLRIG
jgi:hypothetical protein